MAISQARRDEYTRLRDIAQKRLKRLPTRKGTPYEKSDVPRLRDIKTTKQFNAEMRRLRTWVKPEVKAARNPNTLSGQQAKARSKAKTKTATGKSRSKSEPKSRALRKDYSEAKKAIDWALKRFKDAGETRAEFYREFSKGVPNINDLSRADAEKELRRMRRYLTSDKSDLDEHVERKRVAVDRMQSSGYDFINMSNIDDFGEFMDYCYTVYKGRMYDSDAFVEIFKWGQNAKISNTDLRKSFEQHMSATIDKVPEIPTGATLSNFFGGKK